MGTIRLFLIDDHRLLTDIWTVLFNSDDRFKVECSTNSSENAISLVEKYQPDIVLLDIAMTPINGFELMLLISKLERKPKVIALSLYNNPAIVKRIVSYGASGYITKNSPKEELFEAINQVYRGGHFFCREIKERIVEDIFDGGSLNEGIFRLTKAELLVIELLKQGFSSKEISILVKVKQKTIEVHRYNIFKKLKVRNVAALINFVNTQGI